ncbi:MAG: RNase adapter RapZ, partial [Oscillospiraceae bacterium]|nr:RNase adapter RapZ [Oscillospiraceae bacterium]
VSGRAGAGKTQALSAFEDMGFYCVDNVPPSMIPVFARMAQQLGRFPRIVVVTDVRTGDTSAELEQCLQELKEAGISFRILFLDCADEEIERRYRETRRRHPLEGAGDGSIIDAVRREKYMLNSIQEVADFRIDTTRISVKQLREQLISMFAEEPDRLMSIRFISFGYKYGVPEEADLMLDVRCLPNPFYVDELRHRTGLDADVRNYVFDSASTEEVMSKVKSLLDTLLPLYREEGKTSLVVGVGCTGGRHRSVAVAEDLNSYISSLGYRSRVIHRDIGKVS